VDFLSPYIGFAGVWIFWLMSTVLSGIILSDKSLHEIAQMFPALPRVDFASLLPKRKTAEAKFEPVEEIADDDSYGFKDDGLSEEEEVFIPEPPPLYPENPVETKIPERKEVIPKAEPIKETVLAEEKQNTIISMAKKVKEEKHAVVVDELEENKQLLEQIEKGKVEKPKNFKLPTVDFLQKPVKQDTQVNEEQLDDKIEDLIAKLAHFKIDGDVVRTYAGPVVSTFEFKPAANIKVSKILSLQDDLAMALRAQTIRIQAPIPGKDVVGIEIPNESVETIYLREIFESKLFKESSSPLTMVLGKDIVGKPFITDLKKLPHLLIAGTTGSGKSVGINSMILSLLYKNSPDNLKLLMIDPKMLEFSIYNDIPHLLTPVITKAKQAIVALNNMVAEMERRYTLMAETRTKNIENYNDKAKKEGDEILPYIVVIIDELADLMMTSGKDVEYSIARLAQMARASGIHLIVATQRPSVDVVTGLIKANLPSRISYKVGQKIDSKIILDQMGAESLLGRGDMLFTPPGMSGVVRLHAPWSSETEIEKIVEFLKSQREAVYDKRFLLEEGGLSSDAPNRDGIEEELDELFDEARGIILNDKKTSISYLQRRLQIGYNRSARIIEQLENQGVLSAPNAKGNREILAS
jgi:DNA segregation ATPase FtsK/SpoIIIE, S-DNA-T family